MRINSESHGRKSDEDDGGDDEGDGAGKVEAAGKRAGEAAHECWEIGEIKKRRRKRKGRMCAHISEGREDRGTGVGEGKRVDRR